MVDVSENLGLPYIMPSQAQKHVTHNEALRILDALVHLSVEARDLTAPPVAPTSGARYLVAAGATGDWAGQAGRVAVWTAGAWVFHAPLPGWQAYVRAEGWIMVFDGARWVSARAGLAPDELQNLDRLGVGTAADEINRLAVAADATLLSHAGADHRLKINKSGTHDTASLLFQSDWTGHAEMGLTGGTDFTLRVSADGTGFVDALAAEAASGAVSLPGGLKLGGSVLRHYEEGTWTPRLTFGGSDAGIAYDLCKGYFTRIGNLVVLQCAIKLAARGTGTSAAEITGLPFSPNPLHFPGEVFFIGGGSGLSAPKCWIVPGPAIRLVNSTGTATSNLSHANFTDSANLTITIMHLV